MKTDYDLIVVGGGSGGVRAARLAASEGLTVAIVEGERWGGTCVNLGCIPKKFMKYAADFADEFTDAADYGWRLSPGEFDWSGFIESKNREIHRLNGLYKAALQRAGAVTIEGRGRILDPRTVEVEGCRLCADRILIATGGVPRIPEHPGAFLGISSDQVFDLPNQPESILIVGGGFIALEFAAIFHGLGSRVIHIYRGDLFLRGFDHDLRLHMAEIYRNKGIDLRFNLDLERVEESGDGSRRVRLNDGSTLDVDQVLFATGRLPNTRDLWSPGVSLATESDGTICVDQNFRTSVDSIFALGDVVGRMALTPVAINEAKALVHYWLTGAPVELDYQAIPQAVFSSPTLASVGFTEEAARDKGIDFEVYETRFRPLKQSLTRRTEKVYMKLLVRREDQVVIGIHIAADEAAEIMQGFALAYRLGATKDDFDGTVGIHPTTAEELVTMKRPRD